MNSYKTLLGESIDLLALPPHLLQLSLTIVGVYERFAMQIDEASGNSEEEDKKLCLKAAKDYAKEARETIWSLAVRPAAASEILKGPVGEVFRDCFYRLNIRCESKPEERIQVIKTHPLRLLIDAFLNGYRVQSHFCEDADLDPARMTDAVRVILKDGALDDEKANVVSTTKLASALGKLNLSPVLANNNVRDSGNGVNGDFRETPVGLVPLELSSRERQLWRLSSAITKCFAGLKPTEAEVVLSSCRDLLALHLMVFYGISDFDTLARYTTLLLADLVSPQSVTGVQDRNPGDRQMDGKGAARATPGDQVFLSVGSREAVEKLGEKLSSFSVPIEVAEDLETPFEEEGNLDAFLLDRLNDCADEIREWAESPCAGEWIAKLQLPSDEQLPSDDPEPSPVDPNPVPENQIEFAASRKMVTFGNGSVEVCLYQHQSGIPEEADEMIAS
ncbi:MAG: hypothetical protein MI807_04050 [Verrucomicrobiales bacterium]|nr:hypothetical protein [Verrucomicrobiales bacterium]